MDTFERFAHRRAWLVVVAAAMAVAPVSAALAAKPPNPPKQPKPPKPKPAPKGGAGQLAIARSPAVVVFGASSTVSGRLTGVPKAGGSALTLDQSPYPFNAFTGLANGTTAGGGDYTFTVAPDRNTRYRATAKTSPPTTSAEVDVLVKKKVTIRVRGKRVSGVVYPPHDGDPVALQRRTSRGYRTVASGKLTDAGDTRSRYRLTARRAGVYRVRVAADADHLTGTSGSRRIR